MKRCQKMSINKKVVEKAGLQVCYLVGLNDKGKQLIRTAFMPFFLSFFLFFFPPNNLIQHSVNSENMCTFFLHGWQNNHFAAVQAVCTFWKILHKSWLCKLKRSCAPAAL